MVGLFAVNMIGWSVRAAEVEKKKKHPIIVIPRARGQVRISSAVSCFPTEVLIRTLVAKKLRSIFSAAEVTRSPAGMASTSIIQIWTDAANKVYVLTSTRPRGYTCILSNGIQPQVHLKIYLDDGTKKRQTF